MAEVHIDESEICRDCGVGAQMECMECGHDFLKGCDCIHDVTIEEVNVYCHSCDTVYPVQIDDAISQGIIYISYDDEVSKWNDSDDSEACDWWKKSKADSKSTKLYTTDRHYNCPVELGEVTVYASSAHTRRVGDPAPDFGLYLDTVWAPACVAYQVEWQDFGLPKYFDVAARAIIDAYRKAQAGCWVEVGCIGGHGRTGTALACMAVLSGMTAHEALKHIRSVYCHRAIERKEQEWYVSWFETFVNGGEIPEYGEKLKNPATYRYDTPIDWQTLEVTTAPVGAPPEDIIVRSEDYTYGSKLDDVNEPF